MQIVYLVHDVNDAAVSRRISMLLDGGADVHLAGFRRSENVTEKIGKTQVTDFGRTYNAGFKQRITAVLKTILRLKSYKKLFENNDVIIARNMEVLAIGVAAKAFLYKKQKPILIYESLDIHRLLLKQNIIGKIMRAVEGFLAKRADGLITSSPAFIEEYFQKLSKVKLPTRLIENKVYLPNVSPAQNKKNKDKTKPWVIGWFGVLRCKESLSILANLAEKNAGKIEVILRGKPAYDQMPDFDDIVSKTNNLSFAGPYKYPDDLAGIYEEIDFTWAIDKFEKGLNSSWLLPNRLYEGCLYGAVPIAEESVQTGKYLKTEDLGYLITEPLQENTQQLFDTLSPEEFEIMQNKVENTQTSKWLTTKEECGEIINWIKSLR